MKTCPICSQEYSDTTATCTKDGATLIVSHGSDPLIGMVLKGTFRLDAIIGSGGAGVVYRAMQIPLDRPVAVKIIHPSRETTSDSIQRFLNEARLLSQLNHPNIVSVIDFGNTEDGMMFLVMEYLEGKTLKDFVPEGKGLPCEEIIRILSQVCAGVQAAHRRPVVHRDLKPGNIMIAKVAGGEEVTKVLDFGISKALTSGESQNTKTGVVMGTPGFLSPEQIRSSRDVDTRTDIYALGAILYFMVSGKLPFRGDSLTSVLAKQLSEGPDPIDIQAVSDRQAAAIIPVIKKAMSIDPAERHQSVSELVSDVLANSRAQVSPEFFEKTVTQLAKLSLLDPTKPVPTKQAVNRGKNAHAFAGVFCVAVLGVAAGFGNWEALGKEKSAPSITQNTPEDTGPPVRGVSSERVAMGMSGAFTGAARELGRGMKMGIDAYFNVVNSRGGVHGRKLELIALDDGYEPERALSNARELLEQRQVFGFIGNTGTITVKAVLPYALEQKAIVFGSFTGTSALRKVPPDRYVFNYRASYVEELDGILYYLIKTRKIKAENIAVLAQDDDFGEECYRTTVSNLVYMDQDPKKLLRVGYSRNSSDVGTAVDQLIKNRWKVKAVILIATPTAAANLIMRLKRANMDVPFLSLSFVGMYSLLEAFNELGSDYGKDVVVSGVVPALDSQSTLVLRYKAAMKNQYPSEPLGVVSLEGYIAAELFVYGLERTGRKLTPDSFADALESMEKLDIGFGKPLQYGLSDHQASNDVWAVKFDGKGSFTPFDLWSD